MLRKSVLSALFLAPVLFSGALSAQTPPELPSCFIGEDQATVGVPYYCDFGTALNQFIAPFFLADSGISVGFTFNVTTGSTLPPGISLTKSGVFSGTPTTPGAFNFSIDINFSISFSGQTVSEIIPFPTLLQVNGSATGSTVVNPGGLVFALSQGTNTSSQSIALSSRRSQPITYTATASTNSGGSWLSVSGGGTINPFQNSSTVATVNTSGMLAGTYLGTIKLALSSGENFTLPVLLTVTSNQQSLVLSQTGLFFQAVQGGTAPPSQSVSVLNGGTGSLSFSASPSTLSGGNWLSVSPTSGTASSTSSGSATITADSTSLAPGTYYGSVQFSSTGVTNSPQTISVILTVATPAQSPGPSLSSTGLIFVGQAGAAATAKAITVTNPSPNPLAYSSTPFSDNGAAFYTVSPAIGTLASGKPLSIGVQPNAGLATGVYFGNLTLVFSDATTQTVYQRRVAVVLIVVPSLTGGLRGGDEGPSAFLPRAAGCTPTKLIPVMTQLGDGFKVAASWPSPLEVTVVDDCGTFVTQGGSVITTFSTSDPPLALSSLHDGRWTGTWQPRNTSSNQVTITAQAQETLPPLTGSVQIGGSLQANPTVPVVDAGGVVSAASNTVRQPLAPGAYITIYGKNLSQGFNVAPSLPLGTQLGGTQVLLAGKALPLNFAGTGQINAIVPFDMPVNTVQQLIVQQNGALSVPEPVVLSPAQPAIFTQDQSGSGLGVIVGFKADGSGSFLVDHSHPVSTGDVLVVYCTGLGPVDQVLTVGNAGPSLPLANAVTPVTVTIGGQNASVLFAGLAPTLTVYQMNIVVPPGVTPGADVPIVLTQAGLQSVPVTIAVK
jgi:uncharacterized protein (TIGR03437 family)